MSEQISRDEAQQRSDEIHRELNELYRQIREKESEREKYDRVAYPEDYEIEQGEQNR